MARMDIIRECVEIIENHVEDDFESYMVRYHISYKDGKIIFTRATSSPTGETYSDGGIDTKTHAYTLCEWDANIIDYCNLAVVFANADSQHLKYEYGEDVDCIHFQPIL